MPICHQYFAILTPFLFFGMIYFCSSGSIKFENPLKPCCVGTSAEYSCGSVDENGAKKYSICEDPQSAFFWDNVHPTQQGWEAVNSALEATFHQLVY